MKAVFTMEDGKCMPMAKVKNKGKEQSTYLVNISIKECFKMANDQVMEK